MEDKDMEPLLQGETDATSLSPAFAAVPPTAPTNSSAHSQSSEVLQGAATGQPLFDGQSAMQPSAAAPVPAVPVPAYAQPGDRPWDAQTQYLPGAAQTGEVGSIRGAVHLPDLPDGLQAWQSSRMLFQFWLTVSIVNIFSGLFFFAPILVRYLRLLLFLNSSHNNKNNTHSEKNKQINQVVAGILGTVGASMHVCGCCGGGPSIEGPSKAIMWVAVADAITSGISSLLQLALVIGVSPIFFFNFILALATAAVSTVCARRAKQIIVLLNPVSSGVAII
ncbi:hypothetical protein NFJ02_19g33770 [Pycnococcus provasolii]